MKKLSEPETAVSNNVLMTEAGICDPVREFIKLLLLTAQMAWHCNGI